MALVAPQTSLWIYWKKSAKNIFDPGKSYVYDQVRRANRQVFANLGVSFYSTNRYCLLFLLKKRTDGLGGHAKDLTKWQSIYSADKSERWLSGIGGRCVHGSRVQIRLNTPALKYKTE